MLSDFSDNDAPVVDSKLAHLPEIEYDNNEVVVLFVITIQMQIFRMKTSVSERDSDVSDVESDANVCEMRTQPIDCCSARLSKTFIVMTQRRRCVCYMTVSVKATLTLSVT